MQTMHYLSVFYTKKLRMILLRVFKFGECAENNPEFFQEDAIIVLISMII